MLFFSHLSLTFLLNLRVPNFSQREIFRSLSHHKANHFFPPYFFFINPKLVRLCLGTNSWILRSHILLPYNSFLDLAVFFFAGFLIFFLF